MTEPLPHPLTRRRALAGAATAGVALPLLAACGSGQSVTDQGTSGQATAGGGASTTGSAPRPLAKASDVPVGSGVINTTANVVVTQPTSGTFKGFSATCTHRGCQVGQVVGDTIQCPCHGSEFSITDGAVVQGPATTPLPPIAVKVVKGEVTQA